MAKIKYDKNLDDNKNLEKQAKFYDKADLNDYYDIDDRTKKININISMTNYNQAKNIAALSGIGYQNTLKIAMSIGLAKLLADMKQKSK